MNRVTIEPTEFHDVRSGCITYGFRYYDDNGKGYENNWESIPDDDLEFLKKVIEEADEILKIMLDFVQEFEEGIYIGGEFYEWCDIMHLFWDE